MLSYIPFLCDKTRGKCWYEGPTFDLDRTIDFNSDFSSTKTIASKQKLFMKDEMMLQTPVPESQTRSHLNVWLVINMHQNTEAKPLSFKSRKWDPKPWMTVRGHEIKMQTASLRAACNHAECGKPSERCDKTDPCAVWKEHTGVDGKGGETLYLQFISTNAYITYFYSNILIGHFPKQLFI